MKKNKNFLLFFFLSLFLISCTKEDEKTEINSSLSIESSIVSKLLSTNEISTNKLAFETMLDENERYSYAYNKIHSTASKLRLNNDQKALVDEFLLSLNPRLYIINSIENKDFVTKTLPNWLTRSEKVFSKEELRIIFTTFHTPSESAKMIMASSSDIVNELRLQGYNYNFKSSNICDDPNMIWSECLPRPEPTIHNPDPTPIPGGCSAGCMCIPGYLRDARGKCVRPQDAGTNECDCNTSMDYCSSYKECEGFYGCSGSRIGCGFAFAQACNGACADLF